MTPGELRALAFGFRASRALFGGVELGLFAALGPEGKTLDELASGLPSHPRGLRILADGLVALGVLERHPGPTPERTRYCIPAELTDALLPDRPGYLGNLFLHDLWHWGTWGELDACVRTAAPVDHLAPDRAADRYLRDPEVLRRFLPNYTAAMEQSGAGAAAELASHIAQRAPRSVLDLGTGAGELLIELCQACPGLRAVGIDRKFALDTARQAVARPPGVAAGLGERIELAERDFEKDPIPEGHDAIVLSRILMGLPPARAQCLITRASAALEPGGLLYVHDFDARSPVGAMLSLDMLINTGGEVHEAEAVEAWLAGSGLLWVERRRLLPYSWLWIAEKPR